MDSKIIEKLQLLPGKLKKLEKHKYKLTLDKLEVENDIEIIESGIQQNINDEVDENGKKVYSNESSRKAEFKKRAAVDGPLITKNEELRDIEKELSNTTIEYNYLHSMQTNLRAIIHYFANRNVEETVEG